MRRSFTDPRKAIARKIKQGRGQGKGKDYKPWLRVQDGPSEGFLIRLKGWTTDRVHHLLSRQEEAYLYLLDCQEKVLDIREQFPLFPLERTVEIARRLGIKHPTRPGTDFPIVMTTDFLINVRDGDEEKLLARTVKPAERLTNRVLEKFEIERTYWVERGVDWGIVTDRELEKKSAFIKNIEKLHASWHCENLPCDALEYLREIEAALFDRMIGGTVSLAKAAIQVDEVFGLAPGTSLAAARHFFARGKWGTDMNKPLKFSKPMKIVRLGQ